MLTMFAVAVTFIILLVAEYLSRYKGIHAELTRKLIHILVGTFVAFWPFFLSWRQIQMLSVAFLVVVIVSIRLNVFRSIHAVKRNIMGELLFAVVIGLLALLATSKWIFMAAMLHLSLGDGLAAVVGLGWGENNSYKVFGHVKSRAGSTAFFVTSFCVMAFYLAFSHGTNTIAALFI